MTLNDKNILLIITGGIAAYKSLELIRLIRKAGGQVRCILTDAAQHFVTPMSVSALCEHPVYTDLWSLKDEQEMGHIRLSREADLIVIAPATANIMAQMVHGFAQDLATTTLLAADKPIMIAPAMNHKMWDHPATQDNLKILKTRKVQIVDPTEGDMACGEVGIGRMAEPQDILEEITRFFLSKTADKPLSGVHALVTAGPTYEPIDPVRYIGNRSSGKQGYAIAQALTKYGAQVTLVSGPTSLIPPEGLKNFIQVETAQDMYAACMGALENDTLDLAICSAAVADWAVQKTAQKIKKDKNAKPLTLSFKENPDILHSISVHKNRPALVVGFAAETENLLENAGQKRLRKKCDWILANDVSGERVFGTDQNHVHLIAHNQAEDWGVQTKTQVAGKLAHYISVYFQDHRHNGLNVTQKAV